MGKNKVQCAARNIGTGIGAGILAGMAGTAAITISQVIEMSITKRKAGTGPAEAVEKTLKIHPDEGKKKEFSNQVHWVYGSGWGIVRGLLGITGMNKWLASGIHWAAITGTAMALAPAEGQEPVTEWSSKEIAVDLLHHAVYALAAGCVFDLIYDKD